MQITLHKSEWIRVDWELLEELEENIRPFRDPLDCDDLLVNELLNKFLILLITDYLVAEEEEVDGNEDEDRLETVQLLVMLTILHNNTPKLIIPTPIQRSVISFESFYDAEYNSVFYCQLWDTLQRVTIPSSLDR